MNISISFSSDVDGIALSGVQPVQISAQPKPIKMEIFVDDKLFASQAAVTAFTLSWDTTKVNDGTHLIRAEAVYKTRRSKTQVAVTVKNSNPQPEASAYGSGAYGQGPYGG